MILPPPTTICGRLAPMTCSAPSIWLAKPLGSLASPVFIVQATWPASILPNPLSTAPRSTPISSSWPASRQKKSAKDAIMCAPRDSKSTLTPPCALFARFTRTVCPVLRFVHVSLATPIYAQCHHRSPLSHDPAPSHPCPGRHDQVVHEPDHGLGHV
ncbi:hypothetical protein BC940DRAFT_359985 [Gongronella butleri]|nr:hypothetical protein BC940DRAFT_359985 [Gongronella butleri]